MPFYPDPKEPIILSDHAYQSMHFEDREYPSCNIMFEVNVGSWNMQDKCISKTTNQKTGKDFANSPFDYDESLQNYSERKLKQIDEIIAKIDAGEEVIFLQEVDFLFPITFKGAMTDEARNLQATQEGLKGELIYRLWEKGYKIELTGKETQGTANQKMATIYNANRFDFISSRGVLPTKMSDTFTQNRGLEVVLKDKTKDKEFVATNFHLKYGHDYREEIRKYQNDVCKSGRFCVMGGDTNNVQNEHIDTALGSWGLATNFSQDKTPGALPGALTVAHESNRKWKKAYDRFFTGPSKGCYVQATPTNRSEVIEIVAGQPRFLQIPKGAQRPSRSMPDAPWERGITTLERLYKKYQQATDPKVMREIWGQMKECITWKDISMKNVKSIVGPTFAADLRAPKDNPAKPQKEPGLYPFQVDFEKEEAGQKVPVPAKEQAKTILNEVEQLRIAGANKVGITYSANQEQTDQILATYARGRWETGTNGGNQAEVISEIEKLLKTPAYERLQTVYQTVPITTMKYMGDTAMAADDASVIKSLNNATEFIANGGVLLGWKNGFTPPGRLAIGGGFAKSVITDGQKKWIESWVRDPSLGHKYAYMASTSLGGRTHAFGVNATKFGNLKENYQGMKGDYLKTKILEDFKEEIQATGSKQELENKKRELMGKPEFAVLKTGQGLFTKITGIKTSSVEAFEKMCQDQEANIERANNRQP